MRGAFFAACVHVHRKAIDARRAGRRSAYLMWSALAAVCAAVGAVVVLGLIALFVHAGWWWMALPLGYGAMLPLAAAPVAEHVAAPFGAARLAHFLGRRAVVSGGDPDAAALVWAARAAACRPSPRAIAFVETRLAARGRIGDAEVTAGGLLCAARGDRSAAHALIASVGALAELHPAVRELAGEWLAADDAERGAWPAIVARAEQATAWPASPTTFLLEGVAARMIARADAPSNAELVARWLEAPRRMSTWPIVSRALALAPAPAATTRAPAPAAPAIDPHAPAHTPALPAALAAHVALARGPVGAAELAAAAAAWDRALADADTRIGVLTRAAALGAPADAGDRALRELAVQAAADLADLAESHGVALGSIANGHASPVLELAAARVRHRLLGDLELAFAHLGDRCANKDALPALDEWRALCALRADYDRGAAAGGLELRRLAFVHAHIAVGRLAVWLWNERGEHILSHAMSAWLAGEALAVGDAQALETHGQNARMRLPQRPQRKRWFARA